MERIKIYLIPFCVALLFMSLIFEKQNYVTSVKKFKSDSLFDHNQNMYINAFYKFPESVYKQKLKLSSKNLISNNRNYSLFLNDSIVIEKKFTKIY